MSRIISLNKIDSTNNYAQQHFHSLPDCTLITAEEQTGGKGRNGKSWFSPQNSNLYASYIIKDINFMPYKASWIGGLAALQTINNILNISNSWLKWPNDVYINNKKIAGILCETSSNSENKISGVIIGIGINVNMTTEDLDGIDKPATSILAETGKSKCIKVIGKQLHTNLNLIYNKVLKQGINSIFNEWKDANKLIGKQIEVLLDNKKLINVKVIDIENTGKLIVIDSEANISSIYSGDVSIKNFT